MLVTSAASNLLLLIRDASSVATDRIEAVQQDYRARMSRVKRRIDDPSSQQPRNRGNLAGGGLRRVPTLLLLYTLRNGVIIVRMLKYFCTWLFSVSDWLST